MPCIDTVISFAAGHHGKITAVNGAPRGGARLLADKPNAGPPQPRYAADRSFDNVQ